MRKLVLRNRLENIRTERTGLSCQDDRAEIERARARYAMPALVYGDLFFRRSRLAPHWMGALCADFTCDFSFDCVSFTSDLNGMYGRGRAASDCGLGGRRADGRDDAWKGGIKRFNSGVGKGLPSAWPGKMEPARRKSGDPRAHL